MPAGEQHQAVLRGQVISGRGTSSRGKVTASSISDFFGELQAPGSLNIALDRPVRFDPGKVAFPGDERAYYWAAEINGTRCLITRAKGHPLHVVEIFSPHRLRRKFNLKNGDAVEIKVASDFILELRGGRDRAVWHVFWKFRESWYASRMYRMFIGHFWPIRHLATQSPEFHVKRKRINKVSVCHINLARNPKLRGGERQTEILVEALASEGRFKQRVVVLRNGPLSHRFRSSSDLQVCRVNSRLSAIFACRGASLLHAHEAHAAQVAYAASLFGGRYLITRRLTKPIRPNFYSSATYRNARSVIALTEAVEDSLRARFPKISIDRIPDVWNPESPDPGKASRIKEEFAGKFIIGHAAAMDGPEKGHSVLLQAAQILREESPDIHLILLGGGRLEEELRQQAEGLDNVHFAGWVDDPITWISVFDLFAFPSLIEPLGSTLLDVLRMGVPIVASRVDGIPEIITEGCGVLVPPGDPKALAEQLLRLYRSEELRRRLAERGLEWAKEFSPDLIARAHMKIYQEHGLVLG